MKKLNILLLLVFSICYLQLSAQRYLEPITSTVDVTPDVVYATNITILPVLFGGDPEPEELKMQIYTPGGETDVTDRPMVMYFHTGSFLPPYANGGITGAVTDSTVVEVCTRLAKMGYVTAAVSYRQGWNPTALGADGQDTRTGTLLNAAYRGIQDARAAVRFIRKTVAEDNNPYGVDPDKIVLWGQGTGGYISVGAAFLDRFEEVLLPKFIGSNALPYVDTTLVGNVYGTTQKPLCLPNHVAYSSDFALAVNMGGALGDSTWIDGGGNEPPNIGFHVEKDPFAPFNFGQVIVPTTGDFVTNVSGTRGVVGRSNRTGVNDIMAPANLLLSAENDPLGVNNINEVYKTEDPSIPSLTGPYKLSVDNMYPFKTAGPQSGPWDWWGKPQLDVIIPLVNQATNSNFSSDTLHMNGLLTNPGMSPEQGRAYIDTIIAYYAPRGCVALGLCENIVNVEDVTLTGEEVGLSMAPNPATQSIRIETNATTPIQDVLVFTLNGTLAKVKQNVNESQYTLDRLGLTSGMYIVKLRFEDGIVTKKVIFR